MCRLPVGLVSSIKCDFQLEIQKKEGAVTASYDSDGQNYEDPGCSRALRTLQGLMSHCEAKPLACHGAVTTHSSQAITLSFVQVAHFGTSESGSFG